MKKFIAFAFMALMAFAGTNAYAQQETKENKSEQKALRDAERARQKAQTAGIKTVESCFMAENGIW